MSRTGRKSRSSRRRIINFRNGVLFASPWMIGFLIFTIYPIATSLYYSFTNYNIIQAPQWRGLYNFKTLFLEDDLFWISIKNTLYMVLIGLPLGLIVSLTIAMLLNLDVKGMTTYRTIFYLPSIMPAVASAVLWMWILNPQYGMVNVLLYKIGINGPGWLVDPKWSKPALIMMNTWAVGGAVLIYLAGLKGIPLQLYEAAEIDGANWWNKFWNVTIPMLSPTILFNLIMGLIGTFQYFTAPYIMTRGVGSNVPPGSPRNSTLFYSIYLFQNAFAYFKMGYASAMAWILFVLILLATLIVFKSSASWVYYEGGIRR